MTLRSLLNFYYTGGFSWLEDVYNVLPPILYGILATVGTAGLVYSIVLGVNLAKSENDEKRKAAISRLRNTIIGVGVLLVLVLFINLGIPALLYAFFPEYVTKTPPTAINANKETNAQMLMTMFKTAKYIFHLN